jgi:hypothetical protein
MNLLQLARTVHFFVQSLLVFELHRLKHTRIYSSSRFEFTHCMICVRNESSVAYPCHILHIKTEEQMVHDVQFKRSEK